MSLDTLLEDGNISVRLYHCLLKAGCKTLEDALAQDTIQLMHKTPLGKPGAKEFDQFKNSLMSR